MESGNANSNLSLNAAIFFSYLLHPFFLPSAALIIYVSFITPYCFYPIQAKLLFITMVTISSILLPGLVLLFRYYHLLTANSANIRGNQRIIPLLILSVFYLFTFYLLERTGMSGAVNIFFLTVFLITLLAAAINQYYRISLHTMGWGALLTVPVLMAIVFDISSLPLLLGIVLCAGLAGASRLRTGSHSAGEVYYGYGVGFFAALMIQLFLMQWLI